MHELNFFVRILHDFCKNCFILTRFLQEMPCALSVFRKKRIIYFSKLYVFLYENVARIYQSIQNPAFRVGLEYDKNDPIEKDEIK